MSSPSSPIISRQVSPGISPSATKIPLEEHKTDELTNKLATVLQVNTNFGNKSVEMAKYPVATNFLHSPLGSPDLNAKILSGPSQEVKKAKEKSEEAAETPFPEIRAEEKADTPLSKGLDLVEGPESKTKEKGKEKSDDLEDSSRKTKHIATPLLTKDNDDKLRPYMYFYSTIPTFLNLEKEWHPTRVKNHNLSGKEISNKEPIHPLKSVHTEAKERIKELRKYLNEIIGNHETTIKITIDSLISFAKNGFPLENIDYLNDKKYWLTEENDAINDLKENYKELKKVNRHYKTVYENYLEIISPLNNIPGSEFILENYKEENFQILSDTVHKKFIKKLFIPKREEFNTFQEKLKKFHEIGILSCEEKIILSEFYKPIFEGKIKLKINGISLPKEKIFNLLCQKYGKILIKENDKENIINIIEKSVVVKKHFKDLFEGFFKEFESQYSNESTLQKEEDEIKEKGNNEIKKIIEDVKEIIEQEYNKIYDKNSFFYHLIFDPIDFKKFTSKKLNNYLYNNLKSKKKEIERQLIGNFLKHFLKFWQKNENEFLVKYNEILNKFETSAKETLKKSFNIEYIANENMEIFRKAEKQFRYHFESRLKKLFDSYTSFLNIIIMLCNDHFPIYDKIVDAIIEMIKGTHEPCDTILKDFHHNKFIMGSEKPGTLNDVELKKCFNKINSLLQIKSNDEVSQFERSHSMPFPSLYCWNLDRYIPIMENLGLIELGDGKLDYEKDFHKEFFRIATENQINYEMIYQALSDSDLTLCSKIWYLISFFLRIFSETQLCPSFINKELDTISEYNGKKYKTDLKNAIIALLNEIKTQNNVKKDDSTVKENPIKLLEVNDIIKTCSNYLQKTYVEIKKKKGVEPKPTDLKDTYEIFKHLLYSHIEQVFYQAIHKAVAQDENLFKHIFLENNETTTETTTEAEKQLLP